MITFPDSLPEPLLSGYSYQQADNIIKTEMATGRKRRRKRAPNSPTYLTVSWSLTNEQMALLEGFYLHVGDDGATDFLMNVRTPLGTSVHAVCFDGPLSPAPISKTRWKVRARIEVKRRSTLTEEQTADRLIEPNSAEQFIEGVNDAVESY